MLEVRCSACGNILKIRNGKCYACHTPERVARDNTPKPVTNQISDRGDELVMKCQCGSFDIHYCYRRNSLRCKKCSKLSTYDELVAWHNQ
jgi:hypothetical protein